jgi:hypothetical protein
MLFAQYPNTHLTGIDFSSELIESSKIKIMIDDNLIVSFVHGYNEKLQTLKEVPSLWEIGAEEEKVFNYSFPSTPEDFKNLQYDFDGKMPETEFPQTIGRYGFTGLVKLKSKILAASWNAFYEIDLITKKIKKIISNQYTCYIHKFYADEECIIFALAFNDLVVKMDHNGNIHYIIEINQRLEVNEVNESKKYDYRFVTKPWSGATGYYHFNNIQMINGEIWLTSRNTNSFIVVNNARKKAELKTLNHYSPAMIHDGDCYKGEFYFTSVDGKIIKAKKASEYDKDIFNYELIVTHLHKIDKVENNWCRGILIRENNMHVTLDGRYGSDLAFKLATFDLQFELKSVRRFEWSKVGRENEIKYVTGFDIV